MMMDDPMDKMNPMEDVVPTAAPVPTNSGLMALLAKRREEISSEQVYKLDVPRWDAPRLRMEFGPVDHSILKRGSVEQEQAQKNGNAKKQSEVEINTNADILINACIKIVAIMPDGQEMGLGRDGEYTRFDHDAAIAFNMPEGSSAREVCRKFFITDADLLIAAKKLGEWSGYRNDAVEETLVGES
jgi:hypothetical protein